MGAEVQEDPVSSTTHYLLSSSQPSRIPHNLPAPPLHLPPPPPSLPPCSVPFIAGKHRFRFPSPKVLSCRNLWKFTVEWWKR